MPNIYGADQYLCNADFVETDIDSFVNLYGSDEVFCKADSAKCDRIAFFNLDRSYVKKNSGNYYGADAFLCKADSVVADIWPGSLGFKDRYHIITPLSILFRDRYGISGGTNVPARVLHFSDRYAINQYVEIFGKDKYWIDPSYNNSAPPPPIDSELSTLGFSLNTNDITKNQLFQLNLTQDPTNSSNINNPFQVTTNFNIPQLYDNISFQVIQGLGAGSRILADLSGIPHQFVVNMTESQPITWSLDLIDRFGTYFPINQRSDAFPNVLDEKPFGQAGGEGGQLDEPNIGPHGVIYPTVVQVDLVKFLNVIAKVGGQQWNFMGCGTAWTTHREFGDPSVFHMSWKGTDLSIQLKKENQNLQTIRSTRGPITYAAQALTEMLGKYGVKFDLNAFLADDFVIPVMHRQNGVPLDWIVQIISSLCYEWKMVGGRIFTPYMPVPVPVGEMAGGILDYATGQNTVYGQNVVAFDPLTVTPGFVHDFSKMSVFSEDYEGSMMSMYNRIIAIRAATGTNSYTVNVFDFGDKYSCSFSPALSGVTWIVSAANNGFFSNFKFYKGETLIATRDITIGSVNYGIQDFGGGIIQGADSVKFTWGVLPGGFIGLGAPGTITFHGTMTIDSGTWGASGGYGGYVGPALDQGPDNPVPQLRAFAENLDLIHQYGLRPIEVPASPLFPNLKVLQAFANRMLFRLSRQARKATYKIPLNPFIEPGTIIEEIDMSIATPLTMPALPILAPYPSVKRYRVVTSCSHSFSNDPANRYTIYSGNDYYIKPG